MPAAGPSNLQRPGTYCALVTTDMIISHSRKFILTRTPKAASSSLRLELARLCKPGDVIAPEMDDKTVARTQSLQFKTTSSLFVDKEGYIRAVRDHSPVSVAFDIFGAEIFGPQDHRLRTESLRPASLQLSLGVL